MKIFSNYSTTDDSDFEIINFSGKAHDYYYYFQTHDETFSEILAKLPENWQPDVVIYKDPFYTKVPEGIEKSPYPTVAILGDWFGAIDYLPDTLRKFDYIYTDKHSMKLLKKLGFNNVDYWPMFAHNPLNFKNLNLDRKYDLTFAGSFNSNIQFQRLKLLSRLLNLDSKYKVFLSHNCFKDDYVKLLNQSKIVFNNSIKSEMNMRVFEVCASGALLFIEEGNNEIGNFLVEDEDYVTYNDNNILNKISYYLDNEEKRLQIAKSGEKKISNMSYPNMFKKLLINIQSKKIEPGKNRGRTISYGVSKFHSQIVQQSLSTNGYNINTLDSLMTLLKESPCEHSINDSMVILASLIKSLNKKKSNRQTINELVAILLKLLQNEFKHYLTFQFNKAQILHSLGKKTDSKKILHELINSKYDEHFNFKGIVFPLEYNSPLRYLWSNAISKNILNSQLKDFRYNILQYFSLIKLSDILIEQSKHDEAITYLITATKLLPNHPYAFNKLALFAKQINHPESLNFINNALKLNNIQPLLWEYKIQLLSAKERDEYIEYILSLLPRLQLGTPELKNKINNLKNQKTS